ncbi:putative cell-division initiation protein DivIVA [Selenomonas ruminantium subsp. lactilytica TAM6421]|uniref:Putative cell-division initiation protein DivIVA n=1 Tax=Selenomonas ruminantium subsp. lactilytica (strain NBRC 103574 / TAM6421) TaxID=927704 RepID=I0GPB1_SELRL|nr:DivIVA domain-containing protein [Selenomonas ruminantium]BAL82598.1 putative cell-division initiation protein DivIVA [Selenomonas ruminantium subsp. lactilytica TAM6421]
MLTPMDIHNKDFKRSFRGYNEDEIDDFLDQVVNDYEKLFRENDRLKEELSRAKKDNEQYQQLEQNLKDTLLVAQKTAEEVTSNARKNAEESRENTAKECANKVQEAEMKADKIIEDAKKKAQVIVEEYDRLVREKNNFLRKIKVTLESELAVIDDTMSQLPDPEKEEREKKTMGTQAEALQKALNDHQAVPYEAQELTKKEDDVNKQEG